MKRRAGVVAAALMIVVPLVASCSAGEPSAPAEPSASAVTSPDETADPVSSASAGAADAGIAMESEASVEAQALASRILGAQMTVGEATALIEEEGYPVRVATLNGESMALTMDYQPDRFNLTASGPEGVELVTDISFG